MRKGILKTTSGLTLAIKKVFWKNQTFPSLSRSKKLVMAIMTLLAIETNVHFSGIEPNIKCKELVPE